jgi:hemerythrin-like metal-binding protein
MEKIVWSQQYSVGLPALDAQHQRLLGMVNSLLEQQQSGVAGSSAAQTLAEMSRYANEHFRDEERCMGRAGYPALDAHRSEHRAFVQWIVNNCIAATFEAEVPLGTPPVSARLVESPYPGGGQEVQSVSGSQDGE